MSDTPTEPVTSASSIRVPDTSTAELVDESPQVFAEPVRTQRSGKYTLQRGDTPSSVARKLFGRPSRASELFAANPTIKWRPGVEINVPSE